MLRTLLGSGLVTTALLAASVSTAYGADSAVHLSTPAAQGTEAAAASGPYFASVPPGGVQTTSTPGDGFIGIDDDTKIYYSWSVDPFSNTQVCAEARGYYVDRNGVVQEGYYNAGCGSSGGVSLNWGNVASTPSMKFTSLTGLGARVQWQF